MRTKYYSLLIEQKDENQSINETVLNEILSGLNLSLETNSYKSFHIKVQDTLKYSNFITKSKNNFYEIFKSNDSIKVINHDLKKLAELLNTEYLEEVIFNMNSKSIDYNWKRTSFDKLKTQLTNDLGVSFIDKKNERLVYLIKEKK